MRLQQILHLDDGEFVEARAAEEAKPTTATPVSRPLGWGRAMLNHLAVEAPVDRTLGLRRPAAPQPTRDPYRYDPNRLLPRSALVRRVHVDRVVVEAPQPSAQLCATLGLVYAERHIAAQLADWNTMVPEKRGDAAKAGASL